uniref:Si:ch211-203k16.3 n=1 Tax=Salmo trutta TaxID=8032 RepID=A0A673VK71_SALTR
MASCGVYSLLCTYPCIVVLMCVCVCIYIYQSEEKTRINSSLEHRFHELETHYFVSNTDETLCFLCPPEVQHVRNCPIDCASIYYNGVRRSGLYTVVPSLGVMPVEVYCDMETEGGGWTMLQRRVDGSVTFDRSWREYKDGFGDLHSEFWLGNDYIHDLTSQGDYSLRIDLEDWSNKVDMLYSMYSVFQHKTQ